MELTKVINEVSHFLELQDVYINHGKHEVNFEYIGTIDKGTKYELHLYNCSECHSTITDKHLIKHYEEHNTI